MVGDGTTAWLVGQFHLYRISSAGVVTTVTSGLPLTYVPTAVASVGDYIYVNVGSPNAGTRPTIGRLSKASGSAQFAAVIEDVVMNGVMRPLINGRTAYWRNGVVVIRNPGAADGGTAFVPKNGFDYFKNLTSGKANGNPQSVW